MELKKHNGAHTKNFSRIVSIAILHAIHKKVSDARGWQKSDGMIPSKYCIQSFRVTFTRFLPHHAHGTHTHNAQAVRKHARAACLNTCWGAVRWQRKTNIQASDGVCSQLFYSISSVLSRKGCNRKEFIQMTERKALRIPFPCNSRRVEKEREWN